MDPNDPAKFHIEPSLAGGLAELLAGCSVADLGCGCGLWSDYLNAAAGKGIRSQGYDGIPAIEELTGGKVKWLDLTKPLPPGFPRADWVLCLEVLEHIPAELEDQALANLHCANRRGVVISWGVPGQGGIGHCNCQPNEHAIHWFTSRGYFHDAAAQAALRAKSADVFRNTIMVFRSAPSCT